jgi:hypothetical protein
LSDIARFPRFCESKRGEDGALVLADSSAALRIGANFAS